MIFRLVVRALLSAVAAWFCLTYKETQQFWPVLFPTANIDTLAASGLFLFWFVVAPIKVFGVSAKTKKTIKEIAKESRADTIRRGSNRIYKTIIKEAKKYAKEGWRGLVNATYHAPHIQEVMEEITPRLTAEGLTIDSCMYYPDDPTKVRLELSWEKKEKSA